MYNKHGRNSNKKERRFENRAPVTRRTFLRFRDPLFKLREGLKKKERGGEARAEKAGDRGVVV